jgi:hypothetical protein
MPPTNVIATRRRKILLLLKLFHGMLRLLNDLLPAYIPFVTRSEDQDDAFSGESIQWIASASLFRQEKPHIAARWRHHDSRLGENEINRTGIKLRKL